jgi:hypothetical protein
MTDKAISPLRRRLIEDMTIRRLSPRTQYQYIRHVRQLRGTRPDIERKKPPVRDGRALRATDARRPTDQRPPPRPAGPVSARGLGNGNPAGSVRHDLSGGTGSQEHQVDDALRRR